MLHRMYDLHVIYEHYSSSLYIGYMACKLCDDKLFWVKSSEIQIVRYITT